MFGGNKNRFGERLDCPNRFSAAGDQSVGFDKQILNVLAGGNNLNRQNRHFGKLCYVAAEVRFDLLFRINADVGRDAFINKLFLIADKIYVIQSPDDPKYTLEFPKMLLMV